MTFVFGMGTSFAFGMGTFGGDRLEDVGAPLVFDMITFGGDLLEGFCVTFGFIQVGVDMVACASGRHPPGGLRRYLASCSSGWMSAASAGTYGRTSA